MILPFNSGLISAIKVIIVIHNTRQLLSVSKITYPLDSLGNNKETQQAPEPSSIDYIIITC